MNETLVIWITAVAYTAGFGGMLLYYRPSPPPPPRRADFDRVAVAVRGLGHAMQDMGPALARLTVALRGINGAHRGARSPGFRQSSYEPTRRRTR